MQLDALKRTVDRTAMDLENTRSTVTQLKKDVMEKQNKFVLETDCYCYGYYCRIKCSDFAAACAELFSAFWLMIML